MAYPAAAVAALILLGAGVGGALFAEGRLAYDAWPHSPAPDHPKQVEPLRGLLAAAPRAEATRPGLRAPRTVAVRLPASAESPAAVVAPPPARRRRPRPRPAPPHPAPAPPAPPAASPPAPPAQPSPPPAQLSPPPAREAEPPVSRKQVKLKKQESGAPAPGAGKKPKQKR